MILKPVEKALLNGSEGKGVQKAMEILTALGEIYNAKRFIPVKSAQISGVSFKNLGDAGLEFLSEWADKGARVKIPATLNPAGMDLTDWKKLGFPKDFALKQFKVIDAFRRMGVSDKCTCTPYLVGNRPGLGEHVAWSESSAVSYANSVLGARTNRESGISALAAALTGLTPEYGYHLDEGRKADLIINVEAPLGEVSDYSALGIIVGRAVGGGVPYFRGVGKASSDQLKSLGASMAASGSVALYHVEDVTPEARDENIRQDAQSITLENLDAGFRTLNSKTKNIDLVALGCPHASLNEVEEIAELLEGKKVKAALWVFTSRDVKLKAEKRGLLDEIEKSGGFLVSDTCMVVAPIEKLGFKSIATNSGKAAFYAPSHCGLAVRFGSLKECINAALSGRWGDG